MDNTNLVSAIGLDLQAPYSLGNKVYWYKRECHSGHIGLTDEEIGFTGGTYDGYDWIVPCCLRCIRADREFPSVFQHSVNPKVHLIKI